MKLVIPQYVSLTSSYSHKLVPENYGIEGHRFAPMDYFQSYNTQIPLEEATPERMKVESDRLYTLAKNDVESRISATLDELRGNIDKPTGDGAMNTNELDGIVDFVKMLSTGVPKDEVSKAVVATKDSLNEKQLAFLRNLIKAS